MVFSFYAVCQECGYQMKPLRVDVEAPMHFNTFQCPKCWSIQHMNRFREWVEARRQEMEESGVSDR